MTNIQDTAVKQECENLICTHPGNNATCTQEGVRSTYNSIKSTMKPNPVKILGTLVNPNNIVTSMCVRYDKEGINHFYFIYSAHYSFVCCNLSGIFPSFVRSYTILTNVDNGTD